MQGPVPQAKFLQTGIKMVKIIFFSLQNLIELIKNSIYVRLSDVDVGDLGRIDESILPFFTFSFVDCRRE